MKIGKIILIFILPILFDLLIGCCNCSDPVTLHYSNQSIEVLNLDNSGTEAIISIDNKIDKNAYGIQINVNRKEKISQTQPRFLFSTAAYATSCNCPPAEEFLPTEDITAIKIFTLYDFDDQHLAGSEVSEYFQSLEAFEYEAVTNYVTNLEQNLPQFETPFESQLFLLTEPQIMGKHQFEIEVHLSNQNVLKARTEELELL